MFVALTNTPRPFAWGSTTAIAELLGREPSGAPEAELWFGTHPGSPAVIKNPDAVGGHVTLADWVEADPVTALGTSFGERRLPFLLKVLAAAAPLSLQAHPTKERARSGFERENAARIPIDALHRNYRDPRPKPEIILVVSEHFDALAGFRSLDESRALFTNQGLHEVVDKLSDLRSLVEWLLTRGPGVDEVVAHISVAEFPGDDDTLRLVRTLAEEYPGDPGIVLALLLNHVRLRRGEALYLPAGNIHAYLNGLGVELMIDSDNVLRGGLTPKHVDVAELIEVLDFTPTPAPLITPERVSETVAMFSPRDAGFALARVTGDAHLVTNGQAIALCLEGGFTLSGEASTVKLRRGDVVYITPDEANLTIVGHGELVVALTTPS